MGVLLMLMTIGGLIVAGLLLTIALITKKAWLRNFVFGGVAVWFVFYAIMLVSFSLSSRERTLALNEAKEYCGFYLDCHMHTAVTRVRTAKTLGDRIAKGEFYIVRVKVFSNARREKLGLLEADARVIDSQSRVYDRDTGAEEQMPPQPPFETKILPAESFEKEIVFDLPVDVGNPRLDLREGYAIDRSIESVLIDDEDSILHKRDYCGLTGDGNVAQNWSRP